MSTSFFIFLQLESSKEIISSLLFPNTTKKRVPILFLRYPLSNLVIHWTIPLSLAVNFLGLGIRFLFWFFHSFLSALFLLFSCLLIHPARTSFSFFWFLFVCLHFFDKIDYSVIKIPLIIFPKYKYHVFLSASLRFFSFSLGFLLFVFSSQIRNLWLLLADLKIHSVPNLFSYVSTTFYKVMKRSLIVLWTVPPFLGFPPYFFWMFISLLWLHYSLRLLFCQVLFKNIFKFFFIFS